MDGARLVEEFLKTLGGRASASRPRLTYFACSPATHRVLYGRAPRLRHGALQTPFGRESPPRGTVFLHRRVEPGAWRGGTRHRVRVRPHPLRHQGEALNPPVSDSLLEAVHAATSRGP